MASLTFTELKAELAARGFDGLSSTRAGYFINWARAELDGLYLWPYLEKSVTGTPAPLSISDLGVIEAVTNETLDYALQAADFRGLLEEFGDLSISGIPRFYYVATPSGVTEVATYPSNTDTIGVQYYRVSADLSAGSDTLACPARFNEIVIDMAVRRAYLDSDNFQAAQAVQVEVDRKLSIMVDALLGGQTVQGSGVHQQITGSSADW